VLESGFIKTDLIPHRHVQDFRESIHQPGRSVCSFIFHFQNRT